MQAEYIQDEALALRIRLLPALAFAATFDVPELFSQFIAQLSISQAQQLALYFEKTYVGQSLPGGTFVGPLFPISLWNHHHEVPQGIPRTTKAGEMWHRPYNVTISCYHPNIWKFLVALKREQGLVEVRQAKFLSGETPTKRSKNRANEDALKTLILSYFHRPPLEFLKGVAHRFSMEST